MLTKDELRKCIPNETLLVNQVTGIKYTYRKHDERYIFLTNQESKEKTFSTIENLNNWRVIFFKRPGKRPRQQKK